MHSYGVKKKKKKIHFCKTGSVYHVMITIIFFLFLTITVVVIVAVIIIVVVIFTIALIAASLQQQRHAEYTLP